jgi:hypothetical protein
MLPRPGSPHSKKLSLTLGAARTTKCRASTPQYCLWNQNGTAPDAPPPRPGKLAATATRHGSTACRKIRF